MKRKSLDDLGNLQKEIMEILWDLGEASVRQIKDKLKRKNLAYTSVLTIMQRLRKAGWITHRAEGNTYIYRPLHDRSQEATRSAKQFIDRVFHGDTRMLFQHLIDNVDLTAEDLDAVRKMITRKKREKQS